jgi:hypothetical protein
MPAAVREKELGSAIAGPRAQEPPAIATRITLGSRVDIYPGENELLDIANRPYNDDNCYGWNSETYFAPPAVQSKLETCSRALSSKTTTFYYFSINH